MTSQDRINLMAHFIDCCDPDKIPTSKAEYIFEELGRVEKLKRIKQNLDNELATLQPQLDDLKKRLAVIQATCHHEIMLSDGITVDCCICGKKPE